MGDHEDIDHAGITGVGVGDATAHIADATDAHDASAISFVPAGTIAATNVQAAIEEVASEAAGGSGIPATIVDVKGDIIAATAADTVARLAAGANGTVLMAASGETTGLKWLALARTEATLSGDVDLTTAGDYYDGPTITPAAGTYDVWARVAFISGGTGNRGFTARLIANASATPIDEAEIDASSASGNIYNVYLSARVVADGTNPILVRGSSASATVDDMRREPQSNSPSGLFRQTLLVITRVA